MEFEAVETVIYHGVSWVRLLIEVAGVAVVAWGALSAIFIYVPHLVSRKKYDFNPLRLHLARYLVVALEFQLASDILSTAISPNWDELGKLAVIAIIRTVLNYFLNKEIEQEEKRIAGGEDSGIDQMADEAAK
ncbi:MAG: DUF1622 domain-containing protein [Saprospiraceae bacterium]